MEGDGAVIELKYRAKITAQWLRKCLQDGMAADECSSCPFDGGELSCMDLLHLTAADLLDKLAAEVKTTRR